MHLASPTWPLAATLALALAVAGGAAIAADRIVVPSEAPIAAAEAPAGAIVVNIAQMKYDTPELTIKAGDTVVWVNQEAMPHNVAFKKGVVAEQAFQGVMLKKDQAFAITFSEPGAYDYFCTPHPFMRGKVTVE